MAQWAQAPFFGHESGSPQPVKTLGWSLFIVSCLDFGMENQGNPWLLHKVYSCIWRWGHASLWPHPPWASYPLSHFCPSPTSLLPLSPCILKLITENQSFLVVSNWLKKEDSGCLKYVICRELCCLRKLNMYVIWKIIPPNLVGKILVLEYSYKW